MNSTRVLLSIDQTLYKELVCNLLEQHPEIEVIGQTCNVLEAMAHIVQDKPQVWIHSWQENPDYDAIRSHVQSLAPTLIIVHFDVSNPYAYAQMPIGSLDELIQFTSRISALETSFISHR